MPQFRVYPDEEFREIHIHDALKLRYAVSNRGRMVSFTDEILEGRLLEGGKTDGYRVFRFKRKDDNGKYRNYTFFIAKLVAQAFIPKTSEDQIKLLHLDLVRDNDDVRNLKWATYEEMLQHSYNTPKMKQALKNLQEYNRQANGRKLTESKVIYIKRLLADPNNKTRKKMIAKQFGVSEMQIYRIASGENWGHIKI